ncbi:hypothetical protein AVEN_244443-1 [Araneus ventricosus]|uniref:Uncharacterized protein n=1 Tax=Araneus ventricosus TaxID=182803 RepID=A0A4Y2HY71_ARAVE|nr:hypothetical protein AVEN_244443-1 [Araneus ventricosus]
MGNPRLHGWLEDRKRCRDNILRLVGTKYSPQMVGKTARLQYNFPAGTSGLETRNRPCNQPPSPANNHSSEQSAHVGYDGYEEADRLLKETAESDRDLLSVKAPISSLKSVFKKKMMEDWQSDREDENTGRSTFNILLRVSTQQCYWKMEEILFFTGHGPFPSHSKRFNLAKTANCSCVNTKALLCIMQLSAF